MLLMDISIIPLFVDNNAVMKEHDYAESLKEEFGMEINSEAFCFNQTLSIEVSTCEYQNKYQNDEINQGNMKVDFHSHFSYDSAQNADTAFDHIYDTV